MYARREDPTLPRPGHHPERAEGEVVALCQRSPKVAASQRSASIAAAAPVPAEVMAWR